MTDDHAYCARIFFPPKCVGRCKIDPFAQLKLSLPKKPSPEIQLNLWITRLQRVKFRFET